MSVSLRPVALLAALAALAPRAAADLLVVDSRGLGDATQINDAIALAADGDTILVRPWLAGAPGHYDGFKVVDRDLRIVAERGALVQVAGIQVRQLSAGRTVLVVGFTVPGLPGVAPMVLQDNAGPVRIVRCSFGGDNPWGAGHVGDSEDVVLVGCHFGSSSGPGMTLAYSRTAVYDCTAAGGTITVGLPGLAVTGGFSWLAGSGFWGGPGADHCGYMDGYEGGPGAFVNGKAIAVDTGFEGGPGGYYGYMFCGDQADYGPPIVGNVKILDMPRRALLVLPVVPDEGSVTLTVVGSPGDSVLLFRSVDTDFQHLPGQGGVAHVGLPDVASGHFLGVVPADGIFTVPVSLPPLPAGLEAATLYLQTLSIESGGRAILGSLASLTIYDADVGSTCGGRIYVDADAAAGGDGTSWGSAYRDLSDALADLSARVAPCPWVLIDVWVAEGTYVPPTTAGFSVHQGALYGGFAGGETQLDQRDPSAHPTVLSGDLNGDDLPDFQNRQDNAERIVSLNMSWGPVAPLLDGFVIEAAYDRPAGGWGTAVAGAGDVRSCRFRDNYSQTWAGAVFLSGYFRSVTLADCHFENNRCLDGPGAAGFWRAATVHRCTFIENEGTRGGALEFVMTGGGEQTLVSGSLFVGNDAQDGGAILVESYSWTDPNAIRVAGCTLYANSATGLGGGIRAEGELSIQVTNSILWGNADSAGSGELSQVSLDNTEEREVSYCCVEGFLTLPGEVSFGVDPGFVDPFGPDLLPGTGDEDLRLAAGSPCVDTGDNARVAEDDLDLDGDGLTWEPVPLDLDGLRRFYDDPNAADRGKGEVPIVDRGAYERPGS